MKLFPKEDFESALVKDMGSEMYISPTAHYNVFRQVSLNNAIIRAENKQKDKLVKWGCSFWSNEELCLIGIEV